MKRTNHIVLLFCIICTTNSFSQGQFWRINGNNGITINDYLGTNNNAHLIIRTNATERLRITAAGDVHIKNLACNDCLVMANQQGQLYTDNHTIKNLEEKIKQLEQKLLIMEKLMAKNE